MLLLALVFSLPAPAIEVGAAAPEVSAPQIEAPAKQVSLKALKGSVVYVDFWASWCVPCTLSMPALEKLYRDKRARGFIVVGINKDVATGDVERFLRRVKVTFPLIYDMSDVAAKAFGVKSMPSGYLVDRRGVVRHVHRGFSPETALELSVEIEELLKEPG